MNEKEELNKLLLQMEQYRAQYQAMENQIQTLTLSMAEVNMAKDTLREVGSLKDGQEMLVPIGGNSYLKAKLKEKDRTLIGIGSGVYLEKSREGAISYLEEKSKEIEKIILEMRETMRKIEHSMGELEKRVKELAKKVGEGDVTR